MIFTVRGQGFHVCDRFLGHKNILRREVRPEYVQKRRCHAARVCARIDWRNCARRRMLGISDVVPSAEKTRDDKISEVPAWTLDVLILRGEGKKTTSSVERRWKTTRGRKDEVKGKIKSRKNGRGGAGFALSRTIIL